ncbi:MAG: hypothetical protein R2795_08885 [Saprospiraceae bacterium]
MDRIICHVSDAPLGNHRMRLGTADFGQDTPNPCFSGTFGVTIDFTVNVLINPACVDDTQRLLSQLVITAFSIDADESVTIDAEDVFGAGYVITDLCAYEGNLTISQETFTAANIGDNTVTVTATDVNDNPLLVILRLRSLKFH